MAGSQRYVEIVINSVPFIIPAGYVESENSIGTLAYSQGDTSNSSSNSIPMAMVNSDVSVNFKLTTDNDWFLNTYSVFKGCIESLAYLQTFTWYPSYLRFCSYIGVNEYMEYGQLQSYSFSKSEQNNNIMSVSLTFQRIQINSNSSSKVNTSNVENIVELNNGKIYSL